MRRKARITSHLQQEGQLRISVGDVFVLLVKRLHHVSQSAQARVDVGRLA